MANKTSNNQQQKETTGQRKERVEEPKHSDNQQQGEDEKTYKFRSTSTTAKIETKKREKENNINSELAQEKNSDINNRDVCPLCNRPVNPISHWQGWGGGRIPPVHFCVPNVFEKPTEPSFLRLLVLYIYKHFLEISCS